MSKTYSLILRGITGAIAGIVVLGLVVALGQIKDISIKYETLAVQYQDLATSTKSLFGIISTAVESPETPITLPQEPDIEDVDPNLGVAGTTAFLIAIALAVLVSNGVVFTLATIWQRKIIAEKESIALEHERQMIKAREIGRAETRKAIAQELVADKDVLSELTEWLFKYREGEAQLDASARIHSRVLERLVKHIRLTPISQIGLSVSFDPRAHKTYDQLKPGDEAVVAEPGWRVGRDTIKPPVVRRRS